MSSSNLTLESWNNEYPDDQELKSIQYQRQQAT